MGQKIHPLGFRLGVIRTWDSRWFQDKQYSEWLMEDKRVRDYIYETMKVAAISRIEIERANKLNIIVHTARPGLVIGRRGSGIEDLRKNLEKITNKVVKITVEEVRQPELDAKLIGQNIAEQLQRRVAFRRAMKQAAGRAIKAGAKGIRIECKGRLGGAEIARSERTFSGKVPLHTLRADIDYAIEESKTTYGIIGIKVWVYKGDILPEKKETETGKAANA